MFTFKNMEIFFNSSNIKKDRVQILDFLDVHTVKCPQSQSSSVSISQLLGVDPADGAVLTSSHP